MNGSDTVIVEELSGLVKSSRILKVIFYLFAGLFAILAVVSLTPIASGAIGNDGAGGFEVFANALFTMCVFAIFASIFLIVAHVFSDISRGEPPFTYKQARRIRLISWLLFVYAVLDTIVPKGILLGEGPDASYSSVIRFDEGYNAINVEMFAAAVIFYFLASVFKYGVALQEDSDDTV